MNNDHFKVLREISKNTNSSQRKLANQLGFSLGKLKPFEIIWVPIKIST